MERPKSVECVTYGGLTAAAKGVTKNATGTYAMVYPEFIDDVGVQDPIMKRRIKATIPMIRMAKIRTK